MGHTGKERSASKGGRAPHPWQVRIELGRGWRPLSFLLPLLLLPFLPSWKRKGTPTRIGNPSWTPPIGAPLLGRPPPPPPSFIYVGTGHPKGTTDNLLAVCGAPSTVTHLGHIVVVLRRSPAPVTSSSPSPCCRAVGTLPRPQLDQEYEGRHRAERVLNTEVPYVRC